MRQHYALLTPAHPGYPNAGVSLVGAGGDQPWVGRAGGLVVVRGDTQDDTLRQLRDFVSLGHMYGPE